MSEGYHGCETRPDGIPGLREVLALQEEGELHADFDGHEVTYGFGELDELVLAYATTIHKSQGSEYPAVVIPLSTQHYPMLQLEALREATRELLEAFHEFSPVLRRALQNEHHFDVEKWEQRMSTLLRPIEHPDSAQQDDLFD